ncbi:MAG: PIG-L family deacetylase [Kiritimatiellae bacterium]|nr:PIG-L family deacetylase [Kiritimatiellia bacterium]
MPLHHAQASLLVPDELPLEKALARVTHLGIGAHPDDLEIVALHGIHAGWDSSGFGGIVCTNGGPAWLEVRRREQEEAARIGRYGLLVQLEYDSAAIRGAAVRDLEADLAILLGQMSPQTIYTHSPADRHETHVAVALAVLRVLRRLPPERRPAAVYGVEVWGGLDWLPPGARVELDVSDGAALGSELIGLFRSQIDGGKRYDAAVAGRRAANATFADPYAPDRARELCLALDLTPLVQNTSLDIEGYVAAQLDRFRQEAVQRLRRYSRKGN